MNQENKNISRQQKDDVSRADDRINTQKLNIAKSTIKEKQKELRQLEVKKKLPNDSKQNKCSECNE